MKLFVPALLSKTIQPGILASKKNSRLLLHHHVFNVTGWHKFIRGNIGLTRIRLYEYETCKIIFGNDIFTSQHLCGFWPDHTIYLNVSGNPVSRNNKIIGYITEFPCSGKNSNCSYHAGILSIVPFLDWIAEKTNILITGLSQQIYPEADNV